MSITASERAELLILFKGQAESFKQTSGQVRAEAKGMQADMGDLSKSVNKLAAAYLTLQTAQQVLVSMRLGEKYQESSASLSKFVSNLDAAMDKLRRASKGTVDNLTLQNLALQAFTKDLSFDQIVVALRFAEAQASATGDKLEDIFNKVVLVLGRTEAGVGRNTMALAKFGIYTNNAAEIVEQLKAKTLQLDDAMVRSNDTMAQFDAVWENQRIQLGLFLKEALLPSIVALNQIGHLIQGGAYRDLISASRFARPGGFAILRYPADTQSSLERISALVNDLGNKIVDTSVSSEDYADAIAKVTAELDVLTKPSHINDAKELIATLERLRDLQNVDVATTKPPVFGPDLASAQTMMNAALAQTSGELEQIDVALAHYREQLKGAVGDVDEYWKLSLTVNALEQRRADILELNANRTKQEAAAATQALRDQLETERQLLLEKIHLGENSYEDFRALLRKQAVENAGFLKSDFQARLAYHVALGKLRDEDKRKSEQSISQQAQAYRGYIEDVKNADSLSRAEKARLTIEAANAAMLEFAGNKELVGQFYELRTDAERGYTQFLADETARRTDLLMNLFGNVFLQAFDDILDGSTKRFEQYLGELGKALLRFLATQALIRFFAMLAGGPLAALFGGAIPAGGIVGGGIGGGGGILSHSPGFDPNQILGHGVAAMNSFRDVYPVINPTIQNTVHPTPTQVNVHLDKYGVYSVVKEGERIYNRSAGA